MYIVLLYSAMTFDNQKRKKLSSRSDKKIWQADCKRPSLNWYFKKDGLQYIFRIGVTMQVAWHILICVYCSAVPGVEMGTSSECAFFCSQCKRSESWQSLTQSVLIAAQNCKHKKNGSAWKLSVPIVKKHLWWQCIRK